MPRKPHPADQHDAEVVANAVKFEVSVFLGTGKFEVENAKTLAEAKAKATALEAHHKGRKAMIYGIDAQDRRAMYVAKSNEAKAAPAKAAKAAKPAKTRSTKAAVNGKELLMGSKSLGKRAQIIADAQAGKLPSPPDFTADTHTRFRPKLAEVVEMVKARDLKALKAWKFEGFMSTSPKAIQRYRDLAIMALQAKAAK